MAAQERLLADHIASSGASIVESFKEVKSGLKDRPKLRQAIARAKATRSILVCAKLDRVGRRASEVLTLLDRSDVRVVFADTPHASSLQLGIMAVVAQEEARAISARTKAALAAAKARGVKLGGPNGAAPLVAYVKRYGNSAAQRGAKLKADVFANDLRDFVKHLVQGGLTDAAIAEAMNADGIKSRRGAMANADNTPKYPDARWHETSVRRLRSRLVI